MDALTPRSRQAALEAGLADQEAPRSARAEEEAATAAMRKEVLLAAARPSSRCASPSAFGAAGVQGINLKQMAARAASPPPPLRGSRPGTPRGGAPAAREGTGLSHRSPRQDDQTPRRMASPALAPAALGRASGAHDDGGASEDERSDSGEPGAAGQPAAAPVAPIARAQPVLQIDAPPEGPASPAAPAARESGEGEAAAAMATASSLGFWRTRSSGLAPTLSLTGAPINPRRITGPGGLTAAEILLMDARRPSRADDDELMWAHGGGHGALAATSVDPITEEAAVAGIFGGDVAPEAATHPPAAVAHPPEVAAQPCVTIGARIKRYAQPAVIVALSVALIVTMVFTFAPALAALTGGAAVAAPTAAAVAGGSATAAAAATGTAAALASGFAVAPLVADVIGFVGAQNPAWLQPGLDPSKLSSGPPTAAQCAYLAAMPAVQYLCTGTVAGGVKFS